MLRLRNFAHYSVSEEVTQPTSMAEHGIGAAQTQMSEKAKQEQYAYEAEKVRRRIFDELPDGAQWLRSPNVWLRGRTPEQAIADGDSEAVQELLDSILYVGMV
jgi:hypothetical protein